MDSKKNTPRHIIIKLLKIEDKERILKAAREKKNYPQRSSIRLSADFSKDYQAKRGWKGVFKVVKSKDLHPRSLYPTKLSFRSEGDKVLPR